MHVWVLPSDGAVWFRASSVLFAGGTIVATVSLARRLYDTRTALVAGAILATIPMFWSYALEARSYSAALCAAANAVVAATLVAGHLVILAVAPIPARRAALGIVAALALVAPLGALVARSGTHAIDWTVFDPLWSVVLNFGLLAWAPPLLIVYAALAAIAVLTRARAERALLVCEIAVLVPWLALYAVSFVKPLFFLRYAISVLAPLAILLARGLLAVRPPVARACVAGALLACTGAGIAAWWSIPWEDWRGLVAIVGRDARPGDAIAFDHAGGLIPYTYALRERGTSVAAAVVYPAAGWRFWERPEFENPPLREQERLRLRAAPRIWLVLTHTSDASPIARQLAATHHVAFARSLGFVSLERFEVTSRAYPR